MMSYAIEFLKNMYFYGNINQNCILGAVLPNSDHSFPEGMVDSIILIQNSVRIV